MSNSPFGKPCPHCAHPFDEHQVVTLGDPMDGGIVVCSPTCPCVATWAVNSRPAPEVGDLGAVRDEFWTYVAETQAPPEDQWVHDLKDRLP